MESTAQIVWGLIFGSIGFGFFIYGKKQKVVVPFIVGILLFAVPYLIANVYFLVLAGCALVAIPYFIKI